MKKSFLLLLLFTVVSHAQWVLMNNGMGNRTVYSLATSGNNIFAGTGTYGVYLSTNNGTSWTQTSLNNRTVWSLAVNGNNIFAGTTYNVAGVYLSTNNGTTWTQTSLNNRDVYSLAVNGNNVFAGTQTYGVYLSTNNGTIWTQSGLNSQSVISLAVNGNNIFAGTGANGVYLSTDNGTTWTQTSLNNMPVFSLAVNGNNIFASGYGIYVSNNNGASWVQRNEGLTNFYDISLCILNNYIFVGTGGEMPRGIFRRPLSELTGIHPISNELPKQFSLSQNFPNPFNPTTKIRFSIPLLRGVDAESGQGVLLVIYDILGREVTTLVNEQLSPGTYEVEWDASNYSSVVYYYKLIAWGPSLPSGQGFSGTRKMVLMK